MKTKILVILILISWRMFMCDGQAQPSFAMPPAARAELNRLGEAYAILDQYSREVWPGWDNYLNFPFMMRWQNGLRVMVGYPEPPPGFFCCRDLKVHGLEVWADTSSVNNFEVRLPQKAGGGVIPYGNVKDKPVTIVSMMFRNVSPADSADSPSVTPGDHILVFIHELMHCYQETILKQTFGNLQMNPDLNFALYSEMEGLALQKAYKAASAEESKQYLKDFVTARSHKYSGLNDAELNQARCDEFREGEAVYSEMVILDCLKKGFHARLDPGNDPSYTGFSDPGKIQEKYWKRLVKNTGETLELYEKNYEYGCFQALLLQKYFPGWQMEIGTGSWLDRVLRKELGFTVLDSLQSMKRFVELYAMNEAEKRNREGIEGRNNCYLMFTGLKGRTYIIDCKPLEESPGSHFLKGKPNYKLGLIEMYPAGCGVIRFDSVEFLPSEGLPVEFNELYYIKLVDTWNQAKGKGYRIEYKSREDGDIYTGARVVTPLFTLKAPKIQVRESKGRVRFRILSRS